MSDTTTIHGPHPAHAESAAGRPPDELLEVGDDDAQRLLAVLLGGPGSVRGGPDSVLAGPECAVTWRRAQILTLAAQRISPAAIATIVGVEAGDVLSVIDEFNRDGFASLRPAGHEAHATA